MRNIIVVAALFFLMAPIAFAVEEGSYGSSVPFAFGPTPPDTALTANREKIWIRFPGDARMFHYVTSILSWVSADSHILVGGFGNDITVDDDLGWPRFNQSGADWADPDGGGADLSRGPGYPFDYVMSDVWHTSTTATGSWSIVVKKAPSTTLATLTGVDNDEVWLNEWIEYDAGDRVLITLDNTSAGTIEYSTVFMRVHERVDP